MIFVGIDPGFYGATAFVRSDNDGVWAKVYDTPIVKVEGSKRTKSEYDVRKISDIFTGELYQAREGEVRAGLEVQTPFAGAGRSMGASSAFSLGEGFGGWKWLLSVLRIPFELVYPQSWRARILAGLPKGKDAGRLRAQQLFPDLDFNLKKHHGRADAVLIAEYVRRVAAGVAG